MSHLGEGDPHPAALPGRGVYEALPPLGGSPGAHPGRAKGTEEGHGAGAAGTCGAFLCLSQLQAVALGVLHEGPQTPASSLWGCTSPVLPACTSSGALPSTSRPGRYPPLGTAASVQPQGRVSFHAHVQCSIPGPSLKGWSPSRLWLLPGRTRLPLLPQLLWPIGLR